MIHILLIITIASMQLSYSMYAQSPALSRSAGILASLSNLPASTTASVVLSPLLGMLIAYALYTRYAGRQMDATGGIGTFFKAESLGRKLNILCTLWLGLSFFLLNWTSAAAALVAPIDPAQVVRASSTFSSSIPSSSTQVSYRLTLLTATIAISPLLLTMASLAFSFYPLYRRVQEAILYRNLEEGVTIYPIPSRVRYVFNDFRYNALIVLTPVCIAKVCSDLFDYFERATPEFFDSYPIISELSFLVTLLIVIFLTPPILRVAWGLVRIGPSQLTQLTDAARKLQKVRFSGPYLWPTSGTIPNAMVLGWFWPARYLIFTDVLLDKLEGTHLEAVIGHELAHIRQRHSLWILIALTASILIWGWVFSAGVYLARLNPDDESLSHLSTALGLIFTLLIFGFVSRRFEWQADALSLAHMSARRGYPFIDPAAAIALKGALTRVAVLAGINEHASSFRHGSIALRKEKVDELLFASLPNKETPELLPAPSGHPVTPNLRTLAPHRTANRIKWLSLAGLLTGLVPFAFFSPATPNDTYTPPVPATHSDQQTSQQSSQQTSFPDSQHHLSQHHDRSLSP